MDGRLVEFGRKWQSKVMPVSRFILCWLEGTGEVYVQNTITFKIYLMDRKFVLEKDISHYMFNHLKKMEDSYLENHFPEFAKIASPEGTEPSPVVQTPKVESKPDLYAKWRKTPVNDSTGEHAKTKTADELFADINSASPADYPNNPDNDEIPF